MHLHDGGGLHAHEREAGEGLADGLVYTEDQGEGRAGRVVALRRLGGKRLTSSVGRGQRQSWSVARVSVRGGRT